MPRVLQVEPAELCAGKAGGTLECRTWDDTELKSESLGLLLKVERVLLNHFVCRVAGKAGMPSLIP